MSLTNASRRNLKARPQAHEGDTFPRTAVRKIPKSAVSITGRLASVKGLPSQPFESALERDALVLLDCDPLVDHYQVQPVRIEYRDSEGKARSYTPDIFVSFKADPATGETLKPLLIEVKPRAVLTKHWADLRPKFKAAIRHANEQGWRFMILTEQELRVPIFLENLRFLRGFLKRTPDSRWAMAILEALRNQKECPFGKLLERVCQSKEDHAFVLPTLWHLIAARRIWMDLQAPRTGDSLLRHALVPDAAFLWGPGGPPLRKRVAPKTAKEAACSMVVAPMLSLSPGSHVMVGNRSAVILRVLDLREVMVRDDATGLPERVRIDSLGPFVFVSPKPRLIPDLATVSDGAWKVALERDAVIRPLLIGRRTKERIDHAAKVADVSRVTIYRWLNQFQDSGERASALLPHSPSGGRGKSRMPEAVERIIQQTLNDHYLRSQRPKPSATIEEVNRRCKVAGLEPPHANTVRKRIEWIPEETRARRRFGSKTADHMFRMVQGSRSKAEWPLERIQIDHTPMDLILVDEVTRRPIGRPWLTLAMDEYSRTVLAYHISLDPPGDISTGLCLADAILPKERWLERNKIEAEWPCWGIPGTVYADNAKEFRGNMLQRASQEYGFDLQWRVLGKPEYGAHVERILGTFLFETHQLSGTTFSSIVKRGDYRSTSKATMSLSEIRTWFTQLVLGKYHNSPHSGLDGDTPLERYTKGIIGRGLPDRIGNEAKLRMDFLPYFERTVQHHGLEIDGVTYFHPILKTLLSEKDPATRKLKRKFVVRRDPRDISVVHLLDPKTESYLDIPYRDPSHPPVSIWEWRATKNLVDQKKSDEENENLRFKAIDAMRAVERDAAHRTAKARRDQERRKVHRELDIHGRKARKASGNPPEASPVKLVGGGKEKDDPLISIWSEPVMPFDDIE